MKFLSVLLSDDDFCYMGLYFGFLFREVCAQVGPSMGLIRYGHNVRSLSQVQAKGLLAVSRGKELRASGYWLLKTVLIASVSKI